MNEAEKASGIGDMDRKPAERSAAGSVRVPGRPKTALWVLAVVLAGGVIAAALVIWLGRARRRSLETNAVGSCRAYAEAQIMFHRGDWDNDGELEYATPYTLLNTCTDGIGNPIGCVDSAFATAQGPDGAPKHGYLFQDMETISGKPIDWKNDYALCATPARYGKSGYRTFIVSTDGTVWGKDLGKSRFIKDYPAKPQTQGWVIAE